jgi:hypothetical protein
MNFKDTLSPEFREVFDRTWDAQFFTDRNGKMLAANPRCYAFLGISEEKNWPSTCLEMLDMSEREKAEFLLMVRTVLKHLSKRHDRPLMVEVGYKDTKGHALPFRADTAIYDVNSTRPESLFFSISLQSQVEERVEETKAPTVEDEEIARP